MIRMVIGTPSRGLVDRRRKEAEERTARTDPAAIRPEGMDPDLCWLTAGREAAETLQGKSVGRGGALRTQANGKTFCCSWEQQV